LTRPKHARPAPGLARHITLLAMLLLAPTLALGIFTSQNLASRLRAGQEAALMAAAHATARAVAEQVDARLLILHALAASPHLDTADTAAVALQFARVLPDPNGWLALVDPDDPARATFHGAPPARSSAWSGPFIAAAARTRTPQITPCPEARAALLMAVPVLREDRVRTVLAAPLDRATLSAALQREVRPPGVFSLVLDPTGRTVASQGRGAPGPDWMMPRSIVDAIEAATARYSHAIGGEAIPVRANGPDGSPIIFLAHPLPFDGWTVLVGQQEDALVEAWRGPALLQWLGSLAMAALGLLLAAWFARRLLAGLPDIRGAAPAPLPTARGGFRIAEFEALQDTIAQGQEALRQEAERAARTAAENIRLARTAEDDRLLLQSIVRSLPEPIFVKDRDLRYVLINDAAARSLGWEEKECIGRTASEMARPDAVEHFETQDRAVLAADRIMEFNEQIVLVGGTRPRWFRTIKAPWRDGSGRLLGVVGVARDVTRRRAAEERLRTAEAAMRRIARADSLTVMSLGIAHELNQPLTAASNFLRASLRWLDQGATDPARLAAARSAIEEASTETLRAAEILRHIRDFIDRGQTERTMVELGPLLTETVALVQAARAEERLPVAVDIPQTECAALADRVQLQQVFVNLLRNAIEATDGQEERRLAVSLRAKGGMAHIVLADGGPGLPDEVVERMFEPFVSTRGDGMGIGLSISRTIVEAHGGRISARPRPGGGTEFLVKLPLSQAEATREGGS